MNMPDIPSRICPFCSLPTVVVWVHGHGQCQHCRINIDECCRGECTQPTPNPSEASNPAVVAGAPVTVNAVNSRRAR